VVLVLVEHCEHFVGVVVVAGLVAVKEMEVLVFVEVFVAVMGLEGSHQCPTVS